jgi:hypothetical protein
MLPVEAQMDHGLHLAVPVLGFAINPKLFLVFLS